jgi:magnesium transporter
VQHDVDELEASILSGATREEALDGLVGLRRRVTHLRGGLAPHRPVFGTLALASFHETAGSRAADDFGLLDSRLEQAVQTTESAREMIVGAFDLVMTRTAQRTNDVMKVLTTVSVLLLPATLIAGVFGMNMLPKFFLHDWVFWGAVALMLVVSGSVLLLIHRKGWL